MKKFDQVRIDAVFNDIEQSTGKAGQQTTASPEEQQARAEDLKTQGRKGCKAIRINMAFTPSNHAFIKTMAKASGRTMTEFANLVITAYQREHPELMEKAQIFLDEVNSGNFSVFTGEPINKE